MRKHVLNALMLALALTLTATSALAFNDTKGHWAAESIDRWNELGILKGDTGTGLFRPNDPIKRCELAVVLDRLLAFDASAANVYSDLPKSAYYTRSVLGACGAGVMGGDPHAGLMRPEAHVTREEAAVMIARAFGIESQSKTSFTDEGELNSWSLGPVAGMAKLGYLSGRPDGGFHPKEGITRGEIAGILGRIVGRLVDRGGVQTLSEKGCVVVNAAGVTLKGSVGGDLVIGDSATGVTLDGLRVSGRTIVRDGFAGVAVKNSAAPGAVVLMNTSGKADVLAEDGTVIRTATAADGGSTVYVRGALSDCTVKAASGASRIVSVSAMSQSQVNAIRWEGRPSREAMTLSYRLSGEKILASGSLQYVTGFTGFSKTASMQSGYYVALTLKVSDSDCNTAALSKGNIFTLSSGTITSLPYSAGVIKGATGSYHIQILVRRPAPTSGFTVTLDWDGDGNHYSPTTYTIDMSEVEAK